MMRVLTSPSGGHGTVALWQGAGSLRMCARPDVVFGDVPFDPELLPAKERVEPFTKRSAGFKLDLAKSIGENFVDLFKSYDGWVLLAGFIQGKMKFFTEYGIQGYGIIRHPVDAYVSFLKHRHPNFPRRLGFVDAEDPGMVEWYGTFWNMVVSDLVESGSKIMRYEYLEIESRGTPLEGLVKRVWKPKPMFCNWDEISDGHRRQLFNAVSPLVLNFYPLRGENVAKKNHNS